MRMRIRLNLIIGIWTDHKKHNVWDKEIFIAFSPHESKPRCISESFSAKMKINPTIMRSRCLSIVIYIAYMNTPWEATVTLTKRYHAVV